MAAAFSVAFTTSPLAAGTKLLIEATRQMSAGVSFVPRSEYKMVFLGAAATATPANILAGYLAIYGATTVGKRVFVRATVITSDGQRSAPLSTSVVSA